MSALPTGFMARVRYALALHDAGVYKWRPIITSVVATASALTVLAALQPGILPEALDRHHAAIVQIGKWAAVVVAVCTFILAQTSEKVLPQLPPEPAP
jgi:lysylphosphatidylglycerol synthetase-like protein (DUF2156 family)